MSDFLLMEVARRWWETERKAQPTHMVPCGGVISQPDDRWFDALHRDEQEWIVEHVEKVLQGEVRKSERCPGDRAIWEGRFRCWDVGHACEDADAVRRREWEAKARKARGPRQHQEAVRWRHWYDSMEIDTKTHARTRLFGSTNVGRMEFSNLQVGHILAADQSAHLLWMYVSFSEFEDDWGNILHGCIVDPSAGDHSEGYLHNARSLLIDPHPINLVVPCRQHFATEVMMFGAGYAELKKRVVERDPARSPLRLYVHYEGWDTRYVA